MAGLKMLSLCLLVAADVAAAGSPCGTVAPPVKVTTVTTTPPPNCASFTCPHGWSINANAGHIVCVGGKCNMAACCNQNPCTTHVVTTVTTTPPPTCASFTCPHGWSSNANAGHIVCVGGKCNMATCCNQNPCTTHVVTTVTTTPPPTCASFTCPHGWSKNANAGKTACLGGKCNMGTCCNQNPCTTHVVKTFTTTPATTVTTTPPPTCAHFTCPHGWSLNGNAGKMVCSTGKCNMGTCCNQNPCTTHVIKTFTTTPAKTFTTTPAKTFTTTPAKTFTTTPAKTFTTTPAKTVTTTPPPPTCASFTCPAGSDPKNPAFVCLHGHCSQSQCCKSNPCAPQNVKVPVAPSSPCGTVAPAARKYSASEAVLVQGKAGAVPAWALPLMGVLTMFSLFAFVGIRVRARRAKRSTRQILAVEPVVNAGEFDGEPLLAAGDAATE